MVLPKLEKPEVASWDEWKNWRERAKKEHPVRYFFWEDLVPALKKTFDGVANCYHVFVAYVHNRFVDRTHVLETGLEEGKWHDLSTRILYGCMHSLVVYVEEHCAELYCNELGIGYTGPNASQGLKYIEENNDSHEEIREIYFWWTGRKHQPSISEESGWHDYCEYKRVVLGVSVLSSVEDEASEKLKSESFKKYVALYEKRAREEEEYLNRLVAIRNDLVYL